MLVLGKTLYGKTADVSLIDISTNSTMIELGETLLEIVQQTTQCLYLVKLYIAILQISVLYIVDWVIAIRQCGHSIDSSGLAGLDRRRILTILQYYWMVGEQFHQKDGNHIAIVSSLLPMYTI